MALPWTGQGWPRVWNVTTFLTKNIIPTRQASRGGAFRGQRSSLAGGFVPGRLVRPVHSFSRLAAGFSPGGYSVTHAKSSVRKALAGSPCTLTKFGWAVSRQAKRTATGRATPGELTTTVLPSMRATASRN